MIEAADTTLMDTPPEEDFDRLTALAAMMTNAPVALLSLVGSDSQFFKSAHGLPEPWSSRRGTPLSHSFCRFVVDRGAPLIVEDARIDPLVRDNGAIEGLGVVAYLGEPVRGPSGDPIGAFCVIDGEPRTWSAREQAIVSVLARSAEHVIALRGAHATQSAVMADLMRINEALNAQAAELAMARLTAERALAQQTRFLAGLSHELRTPLNGVLGGVTLLEGACDDAARERFQQLIRASGKALGECVDDLITYCRLGAGIETAEVAAFDPHLIVAQATEAIGALAAEKGLEVEQVVDPATPRRWLSDGRRIEQVLVNLLGNAVKYTARGKVGVSLRPFGEALAFRVYDTGRGVPPEHRETIFEPFNRGDAAAARSAAGTGLGLAIARETAERLRGSLTLERSGPDAGSTFLLLAPQLEAEAEAEALRLPA